MEYVERRRFTDKGYIVVSCRPWKSCTTALYNYGVSGNAFRIFTDSAAEKRKSRRELADHLFSKKPTHGLMVHRDIDGKKTTLLARGVNFRWPGYSLTHLAKTSVDFLSKEYEKLDSTNAWCMAGDGSTIFVHGAILTRFGVEVGQIKLRRN